MPREKWKAKSGSREYFSWRGMRHRCTNPNNAAWHNYGARGIRVCDRWANDFDAFLADMGPCPEGHSLDRIDVNGHYEPENCRWASWRTQSNNKRTSVKIEFNGKTQTIAEWASDLGIRLDTLWRRLQRMEPELALTSENLVEKKASPLVHGTRVAYERFKCRCDECRACNAKRARDRKTRMRIDGCGYMACGGEIATEAHIPKPTPIKPLREGAL